MENDREALQPRGISPECGETPKLLDSIVRKGLFRLCELYEREMNPAWVPLWTENLSHLSPKLLRTGFAELEKTFIPTSACPFPAPAHLLKFVDHVEENAVKSEADLAWERALNLRRTVWNPDIPGRFQRIFSSLSVQEQQACRASGIFSQSDMDPEQIHVWSKKRFLEAYVRWTENAADAFLLEDGPLKNALSGCAKTLELPAPKRFEDLHKRGLQYAEKCKVLSALKDAAAALPELDAKARAEIETELAGYGARFAAALANRGT